MKYRRVYLAAGRIVSPLLVIGLRLVTKLTKRPRVRIVVTNENSELLLIRDVISANKEWTFPGGGVGRSESLQAAAQRELYEETGITIAVSKLRHLRTVPKAECGLPYDAPIFHVSVKKADLPPALHNPKEIADIGWFAFDDTPKRSTLLVRTILTEYRTKNV